MTRKLFYEDQYIKEFEANVISCAKKGDIFCVTLDKTAFFPEGGGQPGDTGSIGEARVIDTKEEEGEVIHLTDKPVFGKVFCALDFDKDL